MRRILLVALAATTALAGERYLGSTEMNPPNGSSNFYSDGGGFRVPANQKLTVWCSSVGFLQVDRNIHVWSDGGTGDAGPAIPYDTARALFPTSTGAALFLRSDAGDSSASGGNIVISTSTATGNQCHWFTRLGTE